MAKIHLAYNDELYTPVSGEVWIVDADGTGQVKPIPNTGGGGSGITDHGQLSGLSDDDHTQYLNTTRHDSHDHSAAMASVVLDDLSDVVETTITTGDLLRWNGTNWVNYADSNYAASGHDHDADYVNITGDTMTGSLGFFSDAAGPSGTVVIDTEFWTGPATYALSIDADVDVSGVVRGTRVAGKPTALTDIVFSDRYNHNQSSSGVPKFLIRSSGMMEWAGDAVGAATDTNLYRSAANVLKTDDTFDAAALTVGGTAVSLAGHDHDSTEITDFTEAVQDVVGGMVTGNTETDIQVDYDDTNGKLNFVVTAGGGGATALGGLSDVTITSPADNNLLAYDTGSSQWINQTAAQAGVSTVGHTHTESEITDLDHYTSTDFDTDFAGKTTTDLAEGTNLYYTTTRANTDIDARVDKAFVDALNVDADTLDGIDSTGFATSSHNHDADYVNITGDIMDGDLTMSDNGAAAPSKAVFFEAANSDNTQMVAVSVRSTYNSVGELVISAPLTIVGGNLEVSGLSGTINGAEILTTADEGSGNGLDADTVDGQHASAFATSGHTHVSSNITDFAEAVSDQVGTMITGNTETGLAVTYDDADNTLDFILDFASGPPPVSGNELPLVTNGINGYGSSTQPARLDHSHTIEAVSILSQSGSSVIPPTHIGIDPISLAGGYGTSLEAAREDHTHTVEIEKISDIVGAMVIGNTETGITVTYQDADNTLDFVIQYGAPVSLTPDLANSAGTGNTGARANHVHNVPAATAVSISNATTNAEGTAASFARSDHTHAVTGFATTSHNHDADYVNVTGDTMTGILVVSGGGIVTEDAGSSSIDIRDTNTDIGFNISYFDGRALFSQKDDSGGFPPAFSDIVVDGIATPIDANDATNKGYVDTNFAAISHTHTESDITDLGSYPDATGQPVNKVAETDGAGGWTFIDTPSGGGGGHPHVNTVEISDGSTVQWEIDLEVDGTLSFNFVG